MYLKVSNWRISMKSSNKANQISLVNLVKLFSFKLLNNISLTYYDIICHDKMIILQ